MFNQLLNWFPAFKAKEGCPPLLSPLMLDKKILETARFWDLEDELYNHEAPFYRYCASGFPLAFGDKGFYEKWQAKRAELEALRLEALREASRITLARRNTETQIL